ncbi:MAG: hypothetical protein MZW92_36310 [Comamonadaceae bacterium]|nr:hypothetical protein [Comamonadaceae bacterium]
MQRVNLLWQRQQFAEALDQFDAATGRFGFEAVVDLFAFAGSPSRLESSGNTIELPRYSSRGAACWRAGR